MQAVSPRFGAGVGESRGASGALDVDGSRAVNAVDVDGDARRLALVFPHAGNRTSL